MLSTLPPAPPSPVPPRYTCRTLFERHKLLFSFQMCAKILETSGKLNMDEYNFFLRGGVVSGAEGTSEGGADKAGDGLHTQRVRPEAPASACARRDAGRSRRLKNSWGGATGGDLPCASLPESQAGLWAPYLRPAGWYELATLSLPLRPLLPQPNFVATITLSPLSTPSAPLHTAPPSPPRPARCGICSLKLPLW